MTRKPMMRWIALLCLAGAAQAAYRMPECRPFEKQEKPTPDAALKAHTSISWYGDSRTASACLDRGSPLEGGMRFSTLAQTLPTLASGRYSHKQRAVSGTSLHALFAGQDGLNRPWAEQMAADHADVVVIAHGTNDAAEDAQAKPPVAVAVFERELGDMVDIARKSGKRVLLLQPLRACDYAIAEDDPAHPVMRDPNGILAPYAEAVSRVGKAAGVPVVDLFDLPVKCEGPPAARDMPDGLHANQAFTRRVAAKVASALGGLLGGLLGGRAVPQ